MGLNSACEIEWACLIKILAFQVNFDFDPCEIDA